MSLIDEAKSIIQEIILHIDKVEKAEFLYNSLVDKYDNLRSEFNKARSSSQANSNFLDKNIATTNSIIAKFKKSSSELGIDISNIKEYTVLIFNCIVEFSNVFMGKIIFITSIYDHFNY